MEIFLECFIYVTFKKLHIETPTPESPLQRLGMLVVVHTYTNDGFDYGAPVAPFPNNLRILLLCLLTNLCFLKIFCSLLPFAIGLLTPLHAALLGDESPS